MGTTTPNTTSERHDSPPPPPKSSKSASLTLTSIGNELVKPIDNRQDSLPLVSAKPSQISVFQQMEQYFYGSETNLWLFVAFVFLTIFAYRSSIEQHTCYYDWTLDKTPFTITLSRMKISFQKFIFFSVESLFKFPLIVCSQKSANTSRFAFCFSRFSQFLSVLRLKTSDFFSYTSIFQ